MKVYYIGNGYDGCYYVRCLLPLVHNGWDGMQTSVYGTKVSKEQMFKGAMNADVVVFHRPDDFKKVEVVELLQQAGKIVVFDNDDTYTPNSGVPNLIKHFTELNEVNKNLMNFAQKADLVTTTTNTLATEFSTFNTNVHVLPNCVDPSDWDQPEKANGKLRIGFVGSVTLNGDYDEIKGVIKTLSARSDVQLVVFGLPPNQDKYKVFKEAHTKEIAFWHSLNIEWQPYVGMSEYFETLNSLKLDVMLIPRKETYFNTCKSNLKFLEASMLEIPVIASTFQNSPYEEIEQGVTGFKAKKGEWLDIINSLDRATLRKIGKQAKEYVLSKYDIKLNSHKWEEIYGKYLSR